MNDLKAEVLVVGQDLPAGLPGIGFVLPNIDADFQCAIEGIPVQLLAERLARRKGVDCDAFRYGSFIVESEEGLTPAAGV
jgi:hypothetical protein